jgi:hypothetical protein
LYERLKIQILILPPFCGEVYLTDENATGKSPTDGPTEEITPEMRQAEEDVLLELWNSGRGLRFLAERVFEAMMRAKR